MPRNLMQHGIRRKPLRAERSQPMPKKLPQPEPIGAEVLQ
jgi:hypothetical protein